MIFLQSDSLNKRFREIINKLSAEQLVEFWDSDPNPLYSNVVIPSDDQHIWFEEGATWAQKYPLGVAVYRILYDSCRYYMVGMEGDCLDRLNSFASSKGLEINDEK